MSVAKLSDEKLVKQATYAGRNLGGLAGLALLVTVGLFVGGCVAGEARMSLLLMALCSGVLCAGYWCLAVAGRRGNPHGVTGVLILFLISLLLNVASFLFLSIKGGDLEMTSTPGVIILLLVVAALASSRSVLLELSKRGLWDGIFGDKPPSGRICIIGNVLLCIGFLSFFGSITATSFKAARRDALAGKMAQTFPIMIRTEEASFIETMGRLQGEYTLEDLQIIMQALETLEGRVEQIQENAAGIPPLDELLHTYASGVEQWRQALVLLHSEPADVERAQAMMKLGDRLRMDALKAYDQLQSATQ